jgi:hypothetical protein
MPYFQPNPSSLLVNSIHHHHHHSQPTVPATYQQAYYHHSSANDHRSPSTTTSISTNDQNDVSSTTTVPSSHFPTPPAVQQLRAAGADVTMQPSPVYQRQRTPTSPVCSSSIHHDGQSTTMRPPIGFVPRQHETQGLDSLVVLCFDIDE